MNPVFLDNLDSANVRSLIVPTDPRGGAADDFMAHGADARLERFTLLVDEFLATINQLKTTTSQHEKDVLRSELERIVEESRRVLQRDNLARNS